MSSEGQRIMHSAEIAMVTLNECDLDAAAALTAACLMVGKLILAINKKDGTSTAGLMSLSVAAIAGTLELPSPNEALN